MLEEAVPMNSGHQVESRVVEVVHYIQLEVVALCKFVSSIYGSNSRLSLTVLPVMRGAGKALFTRDALIRMSASVYRVNDSEIKHTSE